MTFDKAQSVILKYARSSYYEKSYIKTERKHLPYISAYLKKMTPGRALDVGSGWGTMAVWLSGNGWEVDVADIKQILTDELLDAYNICHHTYNFEEEVIPHRHSYDLILMTGVLNLLKYQPSDGIRNIVCDSKFDGTFICGVTKCRWTDAPYHGNWEDVSKYGEDRLPGGGLKKNAICNYKAKDLERLLKTIFHEVKIVDLPKECKEIVGECRGIKPYKK